MADQQLAEGVEHPDAGFGYFL